MAMVMAMVCMVKKVKLYTLKSKEINFILILI